jgi:hypothetical protein
VLGSWRLDAQQRRLMEQLNLWTRCCEISVGVSIHDCFDAQLKQPAQRLVSEAAA